MEPSLNVNNNKYFGIFQGNNNQDYFYFNDDVCIERKLEFNSASLNRTTSLYPLLLLHGSWRLTVKISTFLLADATTYAMRYTSTELELSEKLISTDFLSFFIIVLQLWISAFLDHLVSFWNGGFWLFW